MTKFVRVPEGVTSEVASVRISPDWFVSDLWVDPEHRGKGYADELIKYVGKLAHEEGAKARMYCEPHLFMMYAKHGLYPTGRRDPANPHLYEIERMVPYEEKCD